MAAAIPGRQLRQLNFGFQLTKAAAALPQTALGTIFTVAGGRIVILGLVGQVGTVIQSQANAIKFISTPTVGTAADMCATKDINALEAGALLTITGLQSDAMYGVSAGQSRLALYNQVIPVGTIGLNTAASNTGTIGWTLQWLPLDDGASVS
jgi:hypothetical protein